MADEMKNKIFEDSNRQFDDKSNYFPTDIIIMSTKMEKGRNS